MLTFAFISMIIASLGLIAVLVRYFPTTQPTAITVLTFVALIGLVALVAHLGLDVDLAAILARE